MLDALGPFVRTFREGADEGATMTSAWRRAVEAADQGAKSTAGMRARRGRAAWLPERSLGVEDAGAVSLAAALGAAAKAIAR